MNRRLLTILLLAFLIALACALMLWRLVGNRMVATRPTPTTHIVAAAQDIKIGTVLAASNLRTIEVAGTLPKGAILKPENAIGRSVVSDLYEGEPILETRLASSGMGGGLASIIPKGMRACAVKVDDVVGVAGFVTPGMRVDVLISGVPPSQQAASQTQGTVTRTILQNIQVLSAGTDFQKDAEGKAKQVQVVNLLVSPEEAETLSLASNVRIQLVLRNPLDTNLAKTPGRALDSLFGGATPAVKPVSAKAHKAAPKPFSIEIFNGAKRTEERFSAPEVRQ